MYGKAKRGIAYYVCAPKKAYLPLGHPPSAYWIREDYLLDGLTSFLADRVFGVYRHDLLMDSLATLDRQAHRERGERIAALRRAVTDADTKIKNLIRTLELRRTVSWEAVAQHTDLVVAFGGMAGKNQAVAGGGRSALNCAPPVGGAVVRRRPTRRFGRRRTWLRRCRPAPLVGED